MKKVLVTCPPMLRRIDQFKEQFAAANFSVTAPEVVQIIPEEELIDLVPQFDGWIIGDDPATRKVFEAGVRGNLKAAVKWGVGVDNVDFAAAKELGIPIKNTPGMFGAEVADLAMHYVSGLARQAYVIDRGIRQGEWPKPSGRSLSALTIGLVGHGDIGRHFAKRANAAGSKIIVYDPCVKDDADVAPNQLAVWPGRVDECDMLVLTCALNDRNRGMLNKPVLDAAKAGVQVVNVARGPLIDERALEDALLSEKVSAVALDVFDVEPLPMSSPLRQHPHTIFGSHNGSNTIEAVERASLKAIELLAGFLGGGQP